MGKGFYNLGNTCYLNSALQCLSHIPTFRHDNELFIKDISKRDNNNDYKLMELWLNLQKDIWDNDEIKIINTKDILNEIINRCRKNNINFELFDQNDSNDFLNVFIDFLHNSIKREVNITIKGTPKNKYDSLKVDSIKSWRNFFGDNYSYIIGNCYSQLLSLTSCPNCKNITSNHEPMMTIALTLKNNFNTIYDCFDEFIEEEVLDVNNQWLCENCDQKVNPHKKSTFWKLSDVLILSIKQFRLSGKLNKHIDFPEYLNLSKYLITSKDEYKYKLYGLCIHNGGLNGGHYYAICRDTIMGQWNIYNDKEIVFFDL